ncbi:response regulator, partial [candidate division KSB1 bacterium]|nr:response regulator [candidate division KSB1 bacterium]
MQNLISFCNFFNFLIHKFIQHIKVYVIGANRQQKKLLKSLFNKWGFQSQILSTKNAATSIKFDKGLDSYLILFHENESIGNHIPKSLEHDLLIKQSKLSLIVGNKIETEPYKELKGKVRISGSFNPSEFIAHVFTDILGTSYLKGDISQSIVHSTAQQIVARILLIEDNPINQKVTKEMLKSLGLSVDIAKNGRLGINYAKKKSYDIIILDIQMPDMDGFETATLIRQNESTKQLPIIFVTALSKEEAYVFEGYEA